MRATIAGTKIFNLQIIVTQERDAFIAYMPAFDLVTQGENLEEALRNANEAASLFVEECRAMGTLNSVLTSLGWKRKIVDRKVSFTPPQVVANVLQQLAIPA